MNVLKLKNAIILIFLLLFFKQRARLSYSNDTTALKKPGYEICFQGVSTYYILKIGTEFDRNNIDSNHLKCNEAPEVVLK